jgi:DNA-binding NarL/FixJ family response regulator
VTQILLAHAHPLVRTGLRAPLAAEIDFYVIGEAASAEHVQRTLFQHQDERQAAIDGSSLALNYSGIYLNTNSAPSLASSLFTDHIPYPTDNQACVVQR